MQVNTLTVLANGTLVLRCAVRGHPRPSVEWARNGQTMNVNHHTRMRLDVERPPEGNQGPDEVEKFDEVIVHRLIIAAATVHDGGLYRCLAMSKARQDSQDMRVEVQGESRKVL